MKLHFIITQIHLNEAAILARIEAAKNKTLSVVPEVVQAVTATDNITKEPDSLSMSADRVFVHLRSATPFDLKPVMLSKAYMFDKNGNPYIDVPLRAKLPKPLSEMLETSNLRRYDFDTKPQESHKTGLYIGLIRGENSSWNTIRRISKNSQDSSWWYPGNTQDIDTKTIGSMLTTIFKKELKDADT